MFSVSGRTSTKTGVPPRTTTAVAVETNVNDGITTSSPGLTSRSITAISRAAVHECVSRTWSLPMRSLSHWLHRSVNGPLPARCPFSIASRT